MVLPLLLLGCADPPIEPGHLTPNAHLQRASLALRGHRPSLEEHRTVLRNPRALDRLVDDFMASEAFRETMRHVHGEMLLTDVSKEYFPAGFPALGPLAGRDVYTINQAVTEAPARLAEHIIVEDRPYTELVTADYTVANAIVADVWGLPYDGDGDWEITHWDDGRPQAGVLSDAWYFVRHISTDTNRHRARAAHVARAFLCHDYIHQEVRIPAGVDLTSGGSQQITENPVCVSCHATLDPLASFFTPHMRDLVAELTYAYPLVSYDPNGAEGYVQPAFYGQPANDLTDLGRLIAEDPRFARCTVRRLVGAMTAQDPSDVPHTTVDELLPALLDNGFRIRPLLKAIVLSDAFTRDGSADGRGLFRASPWLLGQQVHDLAGKRWRSNIQYDIGGGTLGAFDVLDNTLFGYRTLAGGPDGSEAWYPKRTATPTTVMVQAELASQAAAGLVEQLEFSGDRRVREQLADAHLRLFALDLDADDQRLDPIHAVWTEAFTATDDPHHAWTLTAWALLQDPSLLTY